VVLGLLVCGFCGSVLFYVALGGGSCFEDLLGVCFCWWFVCFCFVLGLLCLVGFVV